MGHLRPLRVDSLNQSATRLDSSGRGASAPKVRSSRSFEGFRKPLIENLKRGSNCATKRLPKRIRRVANNYILDNMNEDIKFLFKASEEPVIDGMELLNSRYADIIKKTLKKNPNAYVSEWEYALGTIKYKYRIHDKETGKKLKELKDRGIVSGRPKLTGVYSAEEVLRFIQET